MRSAKKTKLKRDQVNQLAEEFGIKNNGKLTKDNFWFHKVKPMIKMSEDEAKEHLEKKPVNKYECYIRRGEKFRKKNSYQSFINVVTDDIARLLSDVYALIESWKAPEKIHKECTKKSDELIQNYMDQSKILAELKIHADPYNYIKGERALISFLKLMKQIPNDPLIACKHLLGVSFFHIDDVAKTNKWWLPKSSKRLRSCIQWFVNRRLENNKEKKLCDQYREEHEFVRFLFMNVLDTQSFTRGEIQCAIDDMKLRQEICGFTIGDMSYVCSLNALKDAHIVYSEITRDEVKPLLNVELPESLTNEQNNTLNHFLRNRLTTVLAAGGCGKTDYCIKYAILIAVENNMNVKLLCPTWNCVQQNKDMVDCSFCNSDVDISVHTCASDAFTNGMNYDACNDYVCIIDECSMLSEKMLAQIFVNNRYASRFLLCGDPDQLPPIGEGAAMTINTLSMENECCKLTIVHRAKNDKLLHLTNQFRKEIIPTINMVESSEECPQFNRDWQNIYECQTQGYTFEDQPAYRLCKEKIAYEYENLQRQKRELNLLAYSNEECKIFHRFYRNLTTNSTSDSLFCKGDPVIFIKNTKYYKNGTLCNFIYEFNEEFFVVSYEPNSCEQDNLNEYIKERGEDNEKHIRKLPEGKYTISVPQTSIMPGYCINAHKAQGRQYDNVVAICVHYHCSKKGIYSMLSRAKQKAVLISSTKIKPDIPGKTLLQLMLQGHDIHLVEKYYDNDYDDDDGVSESDECTNVNLEEVKRVIARRAVPRSVRNAMYERDSKDGRCNCHCCGTQLTLNTFHCGHIVSKHNGGEDNLENLRTICGSCNSSMRTMNLEEFKEKFFTQHSTELAQSA